MSFMPSIYDLKISINSQSDGSIDVTIPTGLLDSKVPPPSNIPVTENLPDASFTVFINGKQVTQFTETKISGARTLSIPFHNGDDAIAIFGNWSILHNP